MNNGHKVIDIHNHFYSKPWLDYLAERKLDPTFKWEGETSGRAYIGGIPTGHVDKAGTFDIDARVADLDTYGIDTQVISHTCPGVGEVEKDVAVEWSTKLNDLFVGFCDKYKGRLYFLATVPAQDIDKSIAELERVAKTGYAKGVQVFSNINGELISDEKFHPILGKAAELGLPVKVHPAFTPLAEDACKRAKLPMQLFGFTLDTTMAVVNMIYLGVFTKHPNLKVVHSHLGGMAPYMMGRVNTAYKRYAKEFDISGGGLPSEVYKKHVWVDTLAMHVPAIKCAVEFMGIDHLLFGTDYPHRASGTVEDNMAILEQVGFSDEDKEKFYSKNAKALFNLE